MNCGMLVFRILRPVIIFAVIAATVAIVHAQPPPIGPDSYRQDKTDIGVGILRNFVKAQIDQVITNTNAQLAQRGTGLSVSLINNTVGFHNPFRLATENPDRPNQYYVKFPMNFGINISIPHLSDRQIYYPLDLNVSCDGWQTGNGVVRITAVTGPPDLQGGNFLEDLVFARDYIDGQVRSHLPAIGAVSQTLPNSRCVTIGASPTGGTVDPNAFIAWDEPGRRVTPVLAFSRLEVTFQRLKRLQARGNGGLLYQPVENILLDTYANFNENQAANLTMKEGDDVALNIPKVVLNVPLPGILVIIANIQQQSGTADTGFTSTLRTANFSPGQHVVQIPKTYIIPPGVGHTKPIIAHTPGYELTYNVVYVQPTINGNTAVQPTRVQ